MEEKDELMRRELEKHQEPSTMAQQPELFKAMYRSLQRTKHVILLVEEVFDDSALGAPGMMEGSVLGKRQKRDDE